MANKEQRKINRWVRAYNKVLAKDSFLGLNRFSVKQDYKVGRDYETLYVFHVIDHKTNQVSNDVVVDVFNFEYKLFWASNNFIVDVRKKEKW